VVVGRVLAAGRPLAGASIACRSIASADELQLLSGPDGQFTGKLSATPLGQVRVAFEHSGYAPQVRAFGVDASCSVHCGDVELVPGGQVAGRLLGPGNEAAHDARVVLELVATEASPFARGSARELLCDAAGRFEASALAPGTYRMFGAARGAAWTALSESVVVADGEQVDLAPLELTPGFTQVGRVLAEDGTTVAGVSLRIVRRAEQVLLTPTRPLRARQHDVAPDGRFDLRHLALAGDLLRVEHPGYIRVEHTLRAGDPPLELRLRAEPAVIVRIDGLAEEELARCALVLQQVQVPPALHRGHEAYLRAVLADRPAWPRQLVASLGAGRLRVRGLSPGLFALDAHISGYVSRAPTLLTVPAEEPSPAATLTLERAGSVSGVVRTQADGEPVEGARVALLWAEPEARPLQLAHTDTDASGRFTLERAPSLACTLRVSAEHCAAQSIELTSALHQEVLVELSAPCRLTGKVRADAEYDLSELQVAALDARDLAHTAHVSATGDFALELDPGLYRCRVWSGAGDPSTAADVEVDLRGRTEAQVDLWFRAPPRSEVSGSLLINSEPGSGATLSFRSSATGAVLRTVRVDAAGRYQIELPAKSEFVVQVYDAQSRVLLHEERVHPTAGGQCDLVARVGALEGVVRRPTGEVASDAYGYVCFEAAQPWYPHAERRSGCIPLNAGRFRLSRIAAGVQAFQMVIGPAERELLGQAWIVVGRLASVQLILPEAD